MKQYETPIGNISLDTETIRELLDNEDCFIKTDKDSEEEEHSLEMHLPYIRKAFEGYRHILDHTNVSNFIGKKSS